MGLRETFASWFGGDRSHQKTSVDMGIPSAKDRVNNSFSTTGATRRDALSAEVARMREQVDAQNTNTARADARDEARDQAA
ncbi:hypothetical protein CO057_03550 [Candidatus Uhrbacteria bacterium CG_4_9_14_0_2_um_filter_41_50]|uniref:Uncharacterized protein n=1 Tax=Candidatus Uhrbacteria bacterium CG_4_9_14_0_2_um_filter_41_50 TaxID=1975031 RepID=A0A2M8ENQ2_9BACT|nr:MAG: hypothetical protein COZ45_02565 [Candidatus Uhrbacteria bacterium CG_4_10_14_3_um_filter_41_21]PIZ54224.1 MAG: hypothetical protein COY24_04400 [Candidatus Uhrbacteria bacterium CG_4_10_14_0_2_um_filter_41_21]PJB84394.1 MAG: hypothetical protein CO086_03490 [Candidatus Uhrbacteria bacterium CG_4_9_14_0_8_um_filter_41_16]PJC24373.1 MAG: hypothetical protein CO057_03550 [Candidatus Uhrbacteria bacterium CG_4_9_14_0_2_um_filter_41_50]PJE75265.1 MAG: hypothetical protein COV03_00655 [Candi